MINFKKVHLNFRNYIDKKIYIPTTARTSFISYSKSRIMPVEVSLKFFGVPVEYIKESRVGLGIYFD